MRDSIVILNSLLHKTSIQLATIFIIMNISVYATNFSDYHKRTITSEELKNSGLTRIADILILINEWNVMTIDGYTWFTNPNGLANYQRNNCILMIDGKKYNLTTFDVQNINMLPVTISQIDSIEVFSMPEIEQGEFTGNGLIHIHTCKDTSGSSVQFEYMGGNVTGEPGPFILTKYSSHDFQRIGEDYSLSCGYGISDKYFRAYIIQQQHPFMEPAVVKRNYNILKPPDNQEYMKAPLWFDDTQNPKMARISFSIKAGNRNHNFQTDYLYSYKYFLFFKPLGQEIPVNQIYYHIGLNGFLNYGIAYRLSYLNKKLEKHTNALDFDFNWESNHLNGNLNKKLIFHSLQSNIGFTLDQHRLKSSDYFSEKINNIYKLYSDINFTLNKRSRQKIGFMMYLYNHDNSLFKSLFSNSIRFNTKHILNTSLAYSKNSLAEDNNIWYWTNRGYPILHQYNIEYYGDLKCNHYDMTTLDINWTAELDSNVSFSMTSCYRNFQNIYSELQNFQLNTTDYSLFSPITIKSKQKGHIFKQNIEFKYKLFSNFNHSVFYSYQTVMDGSQTFKNVWKSMPAHNFIYKIIYDPFPDVSFWLRLCYVSSTIWPEYQNIDGHVYYDSNTEIFRYTNRIKQFVNLDLQIQKWFWHKRLVTKFLLRNITNDLIRYYPVGSVFGLTYYIKLNVYLPGK